MKIEEVLKKLQKDSIIYSKASEGIIKTSETVINKIKCPRSFKLDGFIEIECNNDFE